MLSLLDIHQSALLILYWSKKIPGPFSLEKLNKVVTDEDHPLKKDYFLYKWFLENAIHAGELPALKKPKPKPEAKKLINAVDIPEEFREYLLQQYDYWITYSDLFAFMDRSDDLPTDSYAHARDALARVAWMLAKKNSSITNQTELFEYLEQLVDELSQEGFILNLGETTLKGCAKEILSAGEAVEKKS